MKGIVVFANGARGVAVTERLLEAGHEVASIIVPSGVPRTEISDLARRTNCHLSAPDDVNAPAFLDVLSRQGTELSVVAGFPTIFRQALIELPVHGTFNLHAGRLPAYRGGSPLQWQIINGESQAGISVLRMDAGIDTGAILAEDKFDVPPSAEIDDLQTIANDRFAELTVTCVSKLAAGSLEDHPQMGEVAYWHQRSPADGRIDFTGMTARQVKDLVRAVTRPYPGAFAFIGRDLVRFWKVDIAPMKIRGVPGRIVWIQGKGPYVICQDGAILGRDVQIDGTDRPLKTGQRLM